MLSSHGGENKGNINKCVKKKNQIFSNLMFWKVLAQGESKFSRALTHQFIEGDCQGKLQTRVLVQTEYE